MKIIKITGLLTIFASYVFAQWEPDVKLTFTSSYCGTSPNNARCVVAEGDTIHVVWYDFRDGNWEIYHKCSTDGGTTWGTDTRLTNAPGNSQYPSVAVSGSNVHVVWRDERDGDREVYYKRSTDGGITWTVDFMLTRDTCSLRYPSIAVSDNNVHVVWSDERDGDLKIYYKCSTDGGVTWKADIRLSNYGSSFEPAIGVSNSYVHVIWFSFADIFYRRSTDGGTTWDTTTMPVQMPAWTDQPSIAVSGNNVHIVWRSDLDYNWEIYHKCSTDGGTTWGIDTRLTNAPHTSWYPSVVASGSNVHVVWEEYRDGNAEIYYKHSTDGGTIWEDDTRLTENAANSWYPSMAVSGAKVHVVWQDNRDGGRSQIYYKRNPRGNVGGIEEKAENLKAESRKLEIYPNPFSKKTVIKYALSSKHQEKSNEVVPTAYSLLPTILIYDATGRLIRQWNYQTMGQSDHIVWNGTDDSAREVPAGVYLVQFAVDPIGKFGSYKNIKKVILLR